MCAFDYNFSFEIFALLAMTTEHKACLRPASPTQNQPERIVVHCMLLDRFVSDFMWA